MRIVIDTNVVISGVFFGGAPRKIIVESTKNKMDVFATVEIIDEYKEIVAEMIQRKQGKLNADILKPFITELNLIETVTETDICRDKDDNKFLSCAYDAKALFIVSGDKDLLELEEFEGIEIITAKKFCELYLK